MSANAARRPPHRSALIRFEPTISAWFARLGRGIALFSVAAFVMLLIREGAPQSLEPASWESRAQVTLLAIVALGAVLAWKWEGPGGWTLIIGGVTLGTLASFAYPPGISLLAALAFVVPGILLVLHWQRHAARLTVLFTTAVVVAFLAAGGMASARIYDYYYGPTHPKSILPEYDTSTIEWLWTGAVDTTSATVKARLAKPGDASLLVSTSPAMTSPRSFAGDALYPDDSRLLTFRPATLEPDTTYYYALALDGTPDTTHPGRLRTFPAGPSSFTFALGSCLRTGSNGQVFDRIREADPLFFLITGDFNYDNTVSTDPQDYAHNYAQNLARPAEQALFLNAPLAYSWDDHDYGGNGSDARSTGRDAVREAYAAYVPHYPLIDGDGGAIYQAFTVGRVRFIVTDTRSERDPTTSPPTMLGDAQEQWLKDELLAAKGAYALTVWVNGVPWIAAEDPAADHWGAYPDERTELANFIAENHITNLAMLSGDAHMLAIDDGTNSNYATTGEARFPVFHAAALDRRGREKGGPYSEGAFPDGGQFGLMTVTDNGGPITVTWSGRDYTGAEIIAYEFTVPAAD